MVREDAHMKARRMLSEGRVTIRGLSDDLIRAEVRGDSARRYDVSWTPAGWSCPCDAALTRCSHVQAVQLVVLEPAGSHVQIG